MCPFKKWMVWLAACILVLISPLSVAEAKESTVYDNFHNQSEQQESESPTTLTEPPQESVGLYVFQFFGAFLLIIILLYLVLRFVSKKVNVLNRSSVFHAIGGHSLGNQRSVQMLMVGDTLYILGVGNSVTLIRTIPPGEEQTLILESVAVAPIEVPGKKNWNMGFFKRKTKQEKWDDHLIEQLKDLQSNQADNKDQT